MSAPPLITHKQSMGYGLLALPLAFVALPMYVNLPQQIPGEQANQGWCTSVTWLEALPR